MKPDLSVEIAGIRMRNPIMPASGCFGYGREMSQFFDLSKLGAVVTKGTTLEPREGNDPPRMCETRAGIINYIGLQNPGIDAVITEEMLFLRQYEVPVIVNISGTTVEEYVQIAQKLDQAEGTAKPEGIEINISCPNVERGGMAFGQDPLSAFEIVREVDKVTSLPLVVKLTPNVTDIVLIAQSVVEAGADVLSLINTLKARAKIRRGPHEGKWIVGGLSGPAIKPVALQKVFEVAQANLGVPIIGMGGISCLEDVLDFLAAGADAVAIGTANFINPNIMVELIEELEGHLAKKKCANLVDLGQKTG